MRISDYALKNRPAVFTVIVMSVLFGLYSYRTLPREASPDITIPYVIVSTFYFGTSPEDLENLVTKPIEKKLAEIDKIKEMRSQSGEGTSMINIEFDAKENIDDMLAKVREKVDLAKPDLPADAEDPYISEINFSSFPILLVNVSGEYDPVKLKRVAEDIQDAIENVPGVLDVTLSGGLEREVQVNVDPERLHHYRLGLEDVRNAISGENLNLPGGSLELGDYSFLLRVPGEIKDPMEIADFVVKADEHFPIYVRDVAEVVFGFKDATSTARMEGSECITIGVSKRAGENIVRIVQDVRRIIAEMAPELPPTTRVTFTSDQSKDIKMMVDELENGIINGLVLVVLVLVFFLGFRTSMFVAVAIPLSMLLTFIVLQAMGYTLNMIVLFSLILALGMLVDNAIVIVENIYRLMEEGQPPLQAAANGVREVGWAVTASTVTTLAAFFPMAFWPGIMGEFMKYLPITLIITLSCSLFVALVINPVICGSLLHIKRKHAQQDRLADSPFLALYRRVLNWSLDHRISVLVLAHASLVGILVLYGAFGTGLEFFPSIDPKKVFVDFELPTGSRLQTTDEQVRRVESQLGDFTNIQTYVAQSGVSTGDFDFAGPSGGPINKGRISIDMVDREYRDESTRVTMAEIRRRVGEVAGAEVIVKEMEEGPPTGAPVTIEISGKDFRELGRESGRILERIRSVEGLVNLQTDFDKGKPEIQVHVDRERAAFLGVGTGMIGGTVRTAFNGSETGSYRDGEDDIDITVRLAERHRQRIEDIEALHLVIEEGDIVPLSSVARVSLATGLGSINRKDQKRVVTVTADVEGRLANDALNEVKDLLADHELPRGYSMSFAGESKDQEEAEAFLSKAFVIAVFSIGMVLVLQFKSLTTPMIIIFSVLLSLVGVFSGLLITRLPFGIIMTGVGVISLAGVVVNNAIVLLDYTIQLRQRGLAKREAVLSAGMTRLRPVLLTATTTILGLVPMATGISFDFKQFHWVIGSDSSQWWSSMAVAVIFGLLFATVLTLIVVPVFYSLVDSINSWIKTRFGHLVNAS
jgi:multidrug efflux pump